MLKPLSTVVEPFVLSGGTPPGGDSQRPAEALDRFTPSDLITAPRALQIGVNGITAVPRRGDGGYCIDGPTATVVYSGDAALQFLQGRTHYSMDTEVAVPRGTHVRVTSSGLSYELSEPGAVLIGSGAEATVQVLAGAPMVVSSENAPVWYQDHGPDTHKWDEITHINGKLYNWHSYQSCFNPADLERLKAAGMVRDDPTDSRYVQWCSYPSVAAFHEELNALQLSPDAAERILPLYQRAYERRQHPQADGYDRSGLVFDTGKVLVYKLRDKFNLWTDRKTDWLVNSTAWAGLNGPFAVGLSYVQAAIQPATPADFQTIRSQEVLHKHPLRNERGQTEAYVVRNGRAALLTVSGRGAEVHILEAGDVAVVDPEVVHSLVAFQGNYEHVCVQVPSTFQYGFEFKDARPWHEYGLQQESCVAQAQAILANQGAGSFPLTVDGYVVR